MVEHKLGGIIRTDMPCRQGTNRISSRLNPKSSKTSLEGQRTAAVTGNLPGGELARAWILDSPLTTRVALEKLQKCLCLCFLNNSYPSREWVGKEPGKSRLQSAQPCAWPKTHFCLTNVQYGCSPWLGSSDNFSSFCIYIRSPATSFHLSCSNPYGHTEEALSLPYMTGHQRRCKTGIIFLQVSAFLPARTQFPYQLHPCWSLCRMPGAVTWLPTRLDPRYHSPD